MRLIDADEYIEQIKKYCVGCDNYKGIRCRACSFDDAMGVVDSMPTIDDAEIRRQTIDEFITRIEEDLDTFADNDRWTSDGSLMWKCDEVREIAEQMKEVRNEDIG